ncbi:Crp/Fnr family transcriptional regulator [Reichenbachiella ulvae]|uniref:Crp/Fnr family transcriptional regulator n=1 Tax=Reichenbachiella ulvae TaxID=2980104 RepID=A0ABT3CVY9_9BACT|nr:Crp/Fnr family transcriptional regulator [Reichenbachiella ulvae]MCV9387736.1 Crp/Fnr family transcriptional regulator [Reichenbachiella ulvae]
MNALEQLSDHIAQFSPKGFKLSTHQLEKFFSSKKLTRKQHLLTAGHPCHYLYFISKGCMRSYFINPKGTEQILNFGIENWWMTDYDNFSNQQISQLNIQALEDSELLCLSRSNFDQLIEQHPEINHYFRVILEKRHTADQRRMQYMFTLTAEEIYKHFATKNTPFLQRVPQYMLASYLGMTPESLSKIRKKLMEEGS